MTVSNIKVRQSAFGSTYEDMRLPKGVVNGWLWSKCGRVVRTECTGAGVWGRSESPTKEKRLNLAIQPRETRRNHTGLVSAGK